MSRTKEHVAPFVGPTWYVAAAWLAGALVAQATVVHYAAIHDVVPSLVLVVVVWYAIRVDTMRAAVYGLIAGLCEDILATHTGGAWTISTTVVAVMAGTLSRGFFADSLPWVGAITALATLVRQLLFWSVMAMQGYPRGLGAMHFRQALLEAAINAAVMLLAMLAVRRFEAARS